MFFWNAAELERKLGEFKAYFNEHRTHSGITGETPVGRCGDVTESVLNLDNYRWQRHCNGLFELPIAA